jgi:asparagine synthase (glutamine-hydrolysing)
MGSVLPPSILHRKKKGFPIPAETWFRFDLRHFVRDTLLDRNSACRQFFDPQAIEEIIASQERGRFSGHQEVWSLLVFESWHKQFIEEFVPAHADEKSAVEVDVFAGRGA